VVVAAGAGVRAGSLASPSSSRPMLGVPMLLRALRPFTGHPEVRQRRHRLAARIRGASTRLARQTARRAAGVWCRVARSVWDSVRAGLDALPDEVTIILIHDAARPFVSRGTDRPR